MTYDFSEITEVKLALGAHANANDGLCFMEMVAWFAGEEHSDTPECACPALGAYGMRLNDGMSPELRDRLLKPLVPMIVGTTDNDSRQRRCEFLAVWVVNKVLPILLRERGFPSLADRCEKARGVSEARRAAAAAERATSEFYGHTTHLIPSAFRAIVYAIDYPGVVGGPNSAASSVYYAAEASDDGTDEHIYTVAVEGLRQAILIWRHDGLMIDNLFRERREKLRELECAR